MLVVKKPTVVFRGPQNFTTNRYLQLSDIFDPVIQKEVFSYLNQLLHEVVELIPTNPDKFTAMLTCVGVFLAAFFKNIPASQAYQMAIEVAKNIPLINEVSKMATKQTTIPSVKIKKALDIMGGMIHTTIFRLLYGIARPAARNEVANVGEYFIKMIALLPFIKSKLHVVGGAGPDEMPQYSQMTADDLNVGTYGEPTPASWARPLWGIALQFLTGGVGSSLLGSAWNGLKSVLPLDNSIRRGMQWVDDHLSDETKHNLAEAMRVGTAALLDASDQYHQYQTQLAAYKQHVKAAQRRNALAVQDYNTFVDFANQQNKEIFEKAKRNQDIQDENYRADSDVRGERVSAVNETNANNRIELERLHKSQDAANLRGLKRWEDFTEDEQRAAKELFERDQEVANLARKFALHEAEMAGANDEVVARMYNSVSGWQSEAARNAVTGVTADMVPYLKTGERLVTDLENLGNPKYHSILTSIKDWFTGVNRHDTKSTEDQRARANLRTVKKALMANPSLNLPKTETGDIAYGKLTPLDYVRIGETFNDLNRDQLFAKAGSLPKKQQEAIADEIDKVLTVNEQLSLPRNADGTYDYEHFGNEQLNMLKDAGFQVPTEYAGPKGFTDVMVQTHVDMLGNLKHWWNQLQLTLGKDRTEYTTGIGSNNPNARLSGSLPTTNFKRIKKGVKEAARKVEGSTQETVTNAVREAAESYLNPEDPSYSSTREIFSVSESPATLADAAVAYARLEMHKKWGDLPYLEKRKNDLYAVKDRVVTSADAFKEDMGTHGVSTKIEGPPDAVHRERVETIQWLKPPSRPEPAIITMPMPYQSLGVARTQAILNTVKPFQKPDIPEKIVIEQREELPNQMVSAGPHGKITHIHTLATAPRGMSNKQVFVQPLRGIKRRTPAFRETTSNLQMLKKKKSRK